MPFRHVAPAPVDRRTRGAGCSRGRVLFCAFADTLEALAARSSALARILDATPRRISTPFTKAKLITSVARPAASGIPENRIVVIQPSADEAVNRARYRHIDVCSIRCLTREAIRSPRLTWRGRHAHGPTIERMGQSILTHLGVSETIAQSDEDYVAIACRLAIDPMWRSALSARILAGIESTGIADFSRYTRSLEEAYTRMIAITQAERR
jgi:predicted O-linked N-acetylglucosamine transferase (SPINDLY family)